MASLFLPCPLVWRVAAEEEGSKTAGSLMLTHDPTGMVWLLLILTLTLFTGGAKLATHSVGAYSRVRKQFKVPIAELEGVQERLANIAQVRCSMCLRAI